MSKHGESLVKTCKESGITRSLFYEIRDGKRTVSDKVWRKLEHAEQANGIGPLGGKSAESSSSPKEHGIGESPHRASGETPMDDQRRSQTAPADPVLLVVLERIAAALEKLSEKKED